MEDNLNVSNGQEKTICHGTIVYVLLLRIVDFLKYSFGRVQMAVHGQKIHVNMHYLVGNLNVFGGL